MRKTFTRTLLVLLVSLSGYAWSANYSNPMEGIFRGIYGETISIEVPSLVSKSPVASEDENGDLSFQLNGSTGYRNFHQLTDLRKGDPIRIEYKEDPTGKMNGMIAVMITKLESETDSESVTTGVVAVPTATQTITTTTTSIDTRADPQ